MNGELNRTQRKHIDEYLNNNKLSLDEIQQAFIDSFTLNKVTNEQAAALFVSIMRNMLQMSHNAAQLNEIGIDSTKLSIDVVTELINVWAKEFAKQL